MFEQSHLEALAAVVRTGTFDAAARDLHLTPSAVSQRIKALERTTGSVLVRRTRPCRPTEAGQVLVRLAGQTELLSRDAQSALRIGGEEPFEMALVVNADSVATWFLPALATLDHLPARFDVHIEDEAYSAELLRDGTAMAAVTSDPTEVQGCRVMPLGSLRYVALATPEFVRTRLAGGVPESIACAPSVRFNRKDELQDRFVEALGVPAIEDPPHQVPSSLGFLTCVRLGMGWGMVPQTEAVPYLASGELLALSDEHPVDVPLYWQHWRVDSPMLAALTDAVRAEAGKHLIR